jgi:hypothetical protein
MRLVLTQPLQRLLLHVREENTAALNYQAHHQQLIFAVLRADLGMVLTTHYRERRVAVDRGG